MVSRSTTETPAGMFSTSVGIRVAVTTTSCNGTTVPDEVSDEVFDEVSDEVSDGVADDPLDGVGSTGGAPCANVDDSAAAYSSMAAWMRRMRSSFVWDRCATRRRPRCWDDSRLRVFHPPHRYTPPAARNSLDAGRSPGSRLAGWIRLLIPGRGQWHFGTSLAAYSCGGSRAVARVFGRASRVPVSALAGHLRLDPD